MTTPTYTLLCIRSFMFLLCFSIAFGRKNLEDKLGDTLFAPKPVEATELRAALVTNSEATDISSSIGLGEVGSQEMHHIYIETSKDSSLGNKQDNINSVPRKIIRGTVSISFSFPIIKIQVPIPKPNITVADINQFNEEEMSKGIVITPTKTNEFGISLGNDGAELGYSYQ
ncbi:unnamed protein product [Arabidopsis lyrata]|uniref:Uncharacterized protein n=1 Tax=Arabidopsis lyrata subsp. lyrata TaxID=81972 RepID=D7KQM3_ARALL|nr:uncharacterized protein LOC9326707 [Arabidopsis lyrata subsp. lyrata]EFH66904.1 hypothetical protein ARALYDRAFT_890064 [Arabidopsis lyrata subsp. lyrata]CAH8253488.1 unnamed protein product [Arabidopsis lyrata]|eukprot:XP_002890645.1 uncharacterized protein LOC9326707 [Arabidopsis lyrata subsp. lyrata]